MATIVAAAGGGNWTVGGTWVGGVAPTAADDAQLTGTSGNVTIDSGAVARSLDCTGYTGNLSINNGVQAVIGDATAGAGNIALKLVAGMSFTTGNAASGFTFASTSATQQTVATAGKGIRNTSFTGTGSSYLLSDTLTTGDTVTLSAGTLNTNNLAQSWGLFVISGATAKTLTLGSSAMSITGTSTTSVNSSPTGLTVTANTATFTFTGLNGGFTGAVNWNGASAVFNASNTSVRFNGAPTLNNVTVTGSVGKTGGCTMASGLTVTGNLTLAGNSVVNRTLMGSDVAGTARTVTVGGTATISNFDFSDITAAGAAGTWTGTSMGNALGNSNITFDAPATQTRSGSGGNWSTAGNWTSRVPLPQDNVIIGAGASGTITADMPRLGADIDFTGFAGTASFASVANTLYGSLNLATGMTVSGTQNLTLAARSSKTVTSNGKTFTQAVTVNGPSATYALADAVSISGASLTVALGSLATAGFAVTAPLLVVVNGAGANFGASTVTLTSTAAATLVSIGSTSTTTANLATFVIGAASANARVFGGGGMSFGTLTYTVAGSTGSLTITGANTFGTINFSDATNARSLLFTAGTTTTVTNFNVAGTAGKLMTVASDIAATHTLSKPSGTVSTDYLSVTNSLAGGGAAWYAGANSTNGGGNTGWIFTAPPVGGGTARRALLGVGA